MSLTVPQIAIGVIAVLHTGFMIGELYPWESPWIMALVLPKWKPPLRLSDDEKHFVSMVVHNAGIYNGIVAAGLFVAAFAGPDAFPIQVALLTGGIVAGLFGFATLTTMTIAQAVFGAIALAFVIWPRL